MKKFIFKISLVILLSTSILVHSAEASSSIIKSSKESIGIGEQFYVDVLVDTQDQSINGAEGYVTFDDKNLTFIRAEEGKSFITFWIEKPVLDKNQISFAGIVPHGFSGLVDPFNSNNKSPGPIIRLIFEGKSGGRASINTSPFSLTLNDGEGSIIITERNSIDVNVDNYENKILYDAKDDTPPTIDAHVTKDENLFGNKYALVFRANDKETGIASVMIKEGNRDWKSIESPYLLEDQSGRSIINLRATNFSGESYTLTIEPTNEQGFLIYSFIIFVIIVIVLLVFKFKKYVFKKEK